MIESDVRPLVRMKPATVLGEPQVTLEFSRLPGSCRADDDTLDRALARLVPRAVAGDEPSRAEICILCAPLLKRYFTAALGTRDEVDDATQHVVMRVLEGLPRYRREGVPFRHWVLKIAHNHAVDRIRARGRVQSSDPSVLVRMQEQLQPAPTGERSDQPRDAFSTLIAPLPRAQREVLVLLHVHDLTATQVARVLGRSAASVRQLHKRARDTLREIVFAQSCG